MKITLLLWLLLFEALPCTWAADAPSDMKRESAQNFATLKTGLKADQSLAPLWPKMGIVVAETTFAMLVITDKISEEEKAPLAAYAKRLQTYNEMQIALFRRADTEEQEVALWQDSMSANDNLRARLYTGEITWGEYNQRRKDMFATFQKAHAAVRAAIDKKDKEAADRARGLANQAWSVTICNKIGTSMICH
jgi:hypothetical protein